MGGENNRLLNALSQNTRVVMFVNFIRFGSPLGIQDGLQQSTRITNRHLPARRPQLTIGAHAFKVLIRWKGSSQCAATNMAWIGHSLTLRGQLRFAYLESGSNGQPRTTRADAIRRIANPPQIPSNDKRFDARLCLSNFDAQGTCVSGQRVPIRAAQF